MIQDFIPNCHTLSVIILFTNIMRNKNNNVQPGRRFREAADGPVIMRNYATMPTAELARYLWLRLTYCIKGPLHLPSRSPKNTSLMTQETPTSFLLPTKTSFLLQTKTSFLLPTKTRYRFENIRPTLKNLAIV